jgi:hypothetical protein
MPRGAILLPVMADDAWSEIVLVMLVHFCCSEEQGCQTPFQGPTEDGYRPTGERAYSGGVYLSLSLADRYWM